MCKVASGGWTQVAADVFGGIEALWIEAVGFDLVATMVVVSLIDGLSQLLVEGTSLSEALAEEVAPFGSQTATRQSVDLYPLAVFEAAFGHHEVDVRCEADLATGWTEAGLAGEGDAPLVATAGANVASVAGAGIAAEHHAFDGLADVGLLIERDLGVEAQIAPGIPVIAKDVTEAIVSGEVSGVAPGG